MSGRDLPSMLAHAMRVLADLGAADLMSHISARIPGASQIAATPGWGSGPAAPHLLQVQDVLTLAPDGTVLSGRGRPSPLVAVDLAVYRLRRDVGVVAFVRPWVTCAFGIARRVLRGPTWVPNWPRRWRSVRVWACR